MKNELPERFRLLDDQQWLELLIRSIGESEIDGVRFPGFPDQAVQSGFVGSANEPALREAFNFYVLVKGYAAALGMPVGRDRRFLDFGMGWGRFLRFFWRDTAVSNLYGCDVDPDIIQIARDLGVPGNFDRLYDFGKLPYSDGFLQGGMAYSVFTHLPERVHRHWLLELARVMQPGAVFTFTVEPRRFIDFIESIPNDANSDWLRGLRAYADRADEYRTSYDRGQLVYISTGGGEFRGAEVYGDAVVPQAYLVANWAPYFAVRAYIDDVNRFTQAVAVVQRV
jgi:Methyltransferase domain